MHFLQAINSDISVLTVCNKTGGTIKGDIKNTMKYTDYNVYVLVCFKYQPDDDP